MAKRPVTPDKSDSAALVPPAPGAVPAGPTARRRVRRRLLVVLLALLVIGGVAVVEVPQFLSPAPTETIWQAITDGITDGTVPKQTALEAFAYVYRVDIPGVTVPKGIEGGDEPTSGTGVMSWVQANWSALTADQQAVIDRFLPPATEAGTNQMTPAPTAPLRRPRPCSGWRASSTRGRSSRTWRRTPPRTSRWRCPRKSQRTSPTSATGWACPSSTSACRASPT